MACCALAVFLIGQIYGLVAAVRERLGIAVPMAEHAAAASWRPGKATTLPVASRSATRLRPATAIWLASFGALALAVFAFARTTPEERAAHFREMIENPVNWCGAALAR